MTIAGGESLFTGSQPAADEPGGDGRRQRAALWAGVVVAILIGLVLFVRGGSIDDELSRDEAIYAYAGQQLAAGVPPYLSILDVKPPLASMISGAAVAAGRAAGVDDLQAIRIVFLALSVLTVGAVFLACLVLFRQPLVALAGAAAFTTFRGFALDALGGPDAKTPGVLFATLATALLLARRWFLGGLAAGLAVMVWQPFGFYVFAALLAAWLGSEAGTRRRAALRALAGVALPPALISLYFVGVGAFGQFFEAAFLLPVTGTKRPPEEFGAHVVHIVETMVTGYGFGGYLLLVGLAAVVVMVVATIVAHRHSFAGLAGELLLPVVALPLLGTIAFSLVDFQGYPDVYPFLPLGAIGIAAVVAAAGSLADGIAGPGRVPAWAAGGAASLLLAVGCWIAYAEPISSSSTLPEQRADARRAAALLRPGDRVVGLGSPEPLVLMQQRSANRYIYLNSGVDQWVVNHTPGGFDGWTRSIRQSQPRMVLLNSWQGDYRGPMRHWLSRHYRLVQIGRLTLFVGR